MKVSADICAALLCMQEKIINKCMITAYTELHNVFFGSEKRKNTCIRLEIFYLTLNSDPYLLA